MVKRKVIKQANQAYTITLPIEWVRQNNITKDSEVEIDFSEKSLIVTNKGRTEIKKSKIEFNSLNLRKLAVQIKALYARGIDEIEIISKENLTPLIYGILEETIGFALVSNNKDSFIIKDIGGTNYSDLDEIFKRVFQMVLLAYESAFKDIFGKQKETMPSLDARDKEINKFCTFLERAISKMSYPDQVNSRVLFAYSFALEKIGDEIHRLWRTNIKYGIKTTEGVKNLVELSNQGLSLSFDIYYHPNTENVDKLFSIRNEVREKSMNLFKLDAHTTRFVRHAVKIIEDAADLSHLSLIKSL
ncbi:phosphate uptake regulator PhoU [Candidatus Pacearchaeota archaeon]|nr:phosphate uptake regulator PhoU [Candidatus Pacearchaeota archaeon]